MVTCTVTSLESLDQAIAYGLKHGCTARDHRRPPEIYEQSLQLLLLLLQHPDLGHHLLVLFVGRAGRRGSRADGQRDAGGERRQAVAGVEGSDSHV